MIDAELIQQLNKRGMNFEQDYPLSICSGFRTGGNARYAISPLTVTRFVSAVKFCKKHSIPHYIMGGGFNTVVSDRGYDGVVIFTKRLNSYSFKHNELIAQCGAPLMEVCLAAQKASLSGLEFAYGIPATIGGAVFMNAGAYGGEIGDVIMTADILTPNGDIETYTRKQLDFSYRHSALQDNGGIVLSARILLNHDDPAEISSRMDEIVGKRRAKQPLNLPSCGSTFKRPVGAYAAALIEQCGLKGFSVGGASVSTKHAGFIVNNGTATSDDIISVIYKVRMTVREKTGYDLQPEVRFLGF